MPVPVPRTYKSPAHPVFKKRPNSSQDGDNEAFPSFTFTAPLSPRGPPPSFGTREQWINSLPTWRRTKQRRIWEEDEVHHPAPPAAAAAHFAQGLAFADNAFASKGAHADACPPPLFTMLGNESTATTPPPHFEQNEYQMQMNHRLSSAAPDQMRVIGEQGAFTPVFEDDSSSGSGEADGGSSPLQPSTPINDFIDRNNAVVFDPYSAPAPESGNYIASAASQRNPSCEHTSQIADEPAYKASDSPSATSEYRKLAEPLSEWVANIVWKLCIVHVQMPSDISRVMYGPTGSYPASAPKQLAASVHAVLLSTLLQPSAVFLAVWYITRLPTYFGAVNSLSGKELLFRSALLGDVDSSEANAPFRLVILGCMLANKWLDDHTFSNKTWHTISSLNIKSLNQLETFALDLFSYDLSISSAAWGRWLQDLTTYHGSLTIRPQPIGRPSSNPHSIVKKALEEISQAPAACGFNPACPRPVFLGLEERKRAQREKEEALAQESQQIDLDADGPLRAEYVPKRRNGGTVSAIGRGRTERPAVVGDQNNFTFDGFGSRLPPPAKWSPAADEPISRQHDRSRSGYMAVQPPTIPFNSYVSSYSYAPNVWQVHEPYLGNAVKPLQPVPMVLNAPIMHHVGPAFNPCPMYMHIGDSHSRSHSYGHEQHASISREHSRSYSQSAFEHRCSDLRTTAYDLPPPKMEALWPTQYGYGGAFTSFPSAGYQAAWIRT